MAKTSQFIVYQSTDVGAPTLSGTSGSLVTVLDACLVTGYGSKPSAGWNKPFPNSSGSRFAASGSVLGCWQNSSGSGMTLFIHDDRPNSSALFKEAWATGWENLSGLTAPVGTGTGQFPTPAQCLTTGHVVIRKSATSDATARYWTVIADQYTFYMFVQTGDAYYYPFWFGDFYSLKPTNDAYRCFIKGRVAENTSLGIMQSSGYTIGSSFGGYSNTFTGNQYQYGPFANGAYGNYAPRTAGGMGASVQCSCVWDTGKTYFFNYSSYAQQAWIMTGMMNTPNSVDYALWIEPLKIGEPYLIRGRYRGMYAIHNYNGNFSDGQVLQGGGDYAGKTFMVIKGIEDGNWYTSICCHLLEISNTVETND